MTEGQAKDRQLQRQISRLIFDLRTKRALYLPRDYPGVTTDSLNEYLADHGPVFNPFIGVQEHFYEEEDTFVPHCTSMASPARASRWASGVSWPTGGTGPTLVVSRCSQRFFFLQQVPVTGERIRVKAPSVPLITREQWRSITPEELWSAEAGAAKFAPPFAVEVGVFESIDTPHGSALDVKIREVLMKECSVKLAWFIEPKNKVMIEYKHIGGSENNGDYCVYRGPNTRWRDLDGGDVLQVFTLPAVDIDMILDPECLYEEDEEEDIVGLECTVLGRIVESALRRGAHLSRSLRAAQEGQVAREAKAEAEWGMTVRNSKDKLSS